MGTLYLLVPKVQEGGYIPFFMTERKRNKEIWLAPDEEARKRAKEFRTTYAAKFPKAIEILEENLDESLSYYAYP